MAGGNANQAVITLRDGSLDYARVAARVGREYAEIAVQREAGLVCLTSIAHSADHMTAIWWSAAAIEAQGASTAAFRARVMEYLLG